jgi:hypothetical protein
VPDYEVLDGNLYELYAGFRWETPAAKGEVGSGILM